VENGTLGGCEIKDRSINRMIALLLISDNKIKIAEFVVMEN